MIQMSDSEGTVMPTGGIVSEKIKEWLEPIDDKEYNESMKEFRHAVWLKYVFILAGIVVCLIVAGLSLGFGTYPISFHTARAHQPLSRLSLSGRKQASVPERG